MYKPFLFLLSILYTTLSFSQVPFPEIYCNGEKVMNDSVESYFLPMLYEFKFVSRDSIYKIKEGVLTYNSYNKKGPWSFNTNKIYTNDYTVGQSIDIEIKKIEVWFKTDLIRIDTHLIKKNIAIKHSGYLSKNEAKCINDNPGKLFVNEREYDFTKKLTLHKETNLRVSILDLNSKEINIKVLDIILVRGKRPVATKQVKRSSDEIGTVFEKAVKDGDFLVIKAIGENKVLFNKVLFVK